MTHLTYGSQCKGRFLAICELKVLAIVYLSLFDLRPHFAL